MNWQQFYEFLISVEIIPFGFSLFLALLSPFFSNFVEDQVVKRHLPVDLKESAQDIVDFSVDAVRKVGFVSSLYIATVNSFLVIVRSGGWGIYPAVIFTALTLFTFLKLPRVSPYDFQGTVLKVRKFRWLWIGSIVINLVLIYFAYDAFVARLKATAVKAP